MTTVYAFKLEQNKFYISEFKNDIIEPIEKMIEKLVPDNDSEKIQLLLTQNLGTTVSSLEWIKKYPIKSVCKTNYNLEKITSNYMKNYGIDNVRSDLYKDLELSEDTIEYINCIISESSEPISKRIKLIDFEINKLKKIYDIITNNNTTIWKYENYSLNNIIGYVQNRLNILASKMQQLKQIQSINKIQKEDDNLTKTKQEYEYLNKRFQELNREIQKGPNIINLLSFDFKESLNDKVYEDYFLNYKIIEEVANALLLQKKNEKLIFKYGTLDQINQKLIMMFNKKIDLIHSLDIDDISDEEIICDTVKHKILQKTVRTKENIEDEEEL